MDKIYSFRAECETDIERLLAAFEGKGAYIYYGDIAEGFPDQKAELGCDLECHEVLTVVMSVPDSHVIVETLKQCPITENDLERVSR